jgi:hypothetical protein
MGEKFGSGMENSRIRDKHPRSATLDIVLPPQPAFTNIFQDKTMMKKGKNQQLQYYITRVKSRCSGIVKFWCGYVRYRRITYLYLLI